MKISFIVPAYKTPEPLLARSLASIKKLCKDSVIEHEIIVIFDPVVQSVARNIGLRQATGDWIWFVDADDEVVSNVDVVSVVKEADVDIIVFAFEQRWGQFGKRTRFSPPIDFEGELTDACIAREGKGLMFRALWNKLFRRSFLEEKGIMFDEGMEPCEDGMFMIKCLMDKARWMTIDAIGYLYWRRLYSSLFRYCPSLEKALHMENFMWDEAAKKLGYNNIVTCKWSDRNLLSMIDTNRMNAGDYSKVSFLRKVRYHIIQLRRFLRFVKI